MWKSIWNFLFAWMKRKQTIIPPATQEQILWKAYPCPDGFKHGYANENEYRDNAMTIAVSKGFDCLAVTMHSIPNPELSIHLLCYESNVDAGKFLDSSWFFRARNAGISKWVIDITPVINEMMEVKDRFMAYEPNTVQFTCPKEMFADMCKKMELDSNGVKQTKPKSRHG